MDIILSLVVFAIIVWLVFFILGQLPLPEPIKTIITVLFAVIILLYLLGNIGVLDPGRFHILRR